MRRTEQLAVEVVGPAVQRTHDVLRRAAPVEHDGLTVAAHVREELDFVLFVTDEQTPFAFAGQSKITSRLGHHEFVPDIARTAFE